MTVTLFVPNFDIVVCTAERMSVADLQGGLSHEHRPLKADHTRKTHLECACRKPACALMDEESPGKSPESGFSRMMSASVSSGRLRDAARSP